MLSRNSSDVWSRIETRQHVCRKIGRLEDAYRHVITDVRPSCLLVVPSLLLFHNGCYVDFVRSVECVVYNPGASVVIKQYNLEALKAGRQTGTPRNMCPFSWFLSFGWCMAEGCGIGDQCHLMGLNPLPFYFTSV